MKRPFIFIIMLLSIFLISCKSKEYHINIHYSLNEKEDEVIYFNKENINYVELSDITIMGYSFLGYYENGERIDKIELKNYNLETKYNEVEYSVNIHYNGIDREDVEIKFTVSTIKDIILETIDYNHKNFVGFFEGNETINEIKDLRNYSLEAIYTDETVIELFFETTEIDYTQPELIKKFERCKKFNWPFMIISCTTEPKWKNFMENIHHDEHVSINEVYNSKYSFSNDYDLYQCFYLICDCLYYTNEIKGVSCDYLSEIKVSPIITNERKKTGFENYYEDIILNLPLGEIVQFEKVELDFDNFDGDYIYYIDNDSIVERYDLERFVLYINSEKLKKYIDMELKKRVIVDDYTYSDLYDKLGLNIFFEFEKYIDINEKTDYELVYYFEYKK